MTTSDETWTTDPAIRDDDALRGVLDVLAAAARDPLPPHVRHAQVQALLAEVADGRRARPARRRVRSVLALTGVKVVLAGGIAAAGTTTGLATTGTLPAPAQQWAHELGARVGVDLPAPPGQAAKVDGDPDSTGRDHAPGQLKKDQPGTTGRDVAPGQVKKEEPAPAGGDGSSEAVEPGATEDRGGGPPEDVVAPGQSGDRGRSADAPGRSSGGADTP